MSVAPEIIGLAIMLAVALFLYGVIRGFYKYGRDRKRAQLAEQTAQLTSAVVSEEREKKRIADGRAPRKAHVADFKQTRN